MNYFLNAGGGLTTLSWVLISLVPPAIVALYFLKLKRKSIEVPSTFLWRRTIEDLQVNSLWQKLRSSVLLWLQLAIALLLLLTCFRPGCNQTKQIGSSVIIGIDNSASSTSKDEEAGDRLQQSIAEAVKIVDNLKANDQAMVITISDAAKIRQSYTSNKSLLRQKLLNIRPTTRRTDVKELFKLASGIATPSQIEDKGDNLTPEEVMERDQAQKATLKFFSDGRFKEVEDLNLGHLAVDFYPVGKIDTPNVGIVSLNAKPLQKKKRTVEVFYRIENFSEGPSEIEIELFRDGELVDASKIEMEPGKIRSESFEDDLSAYDKDIVHYQLKISPSDAFALDNQADCVVNPNPKPNILLVTEGDGQLEKALSTTVLKEKIDLNVVGEEFLETDDYTESCKNSVFHLVIFDRVAPKQMPMANTMFWGTVPPDRWKSEEMKEPAFILDSDDSHPLMAGINTSGLLFFRCNALTPPPRSAILWESDDGPMVCLAQREGYQDLVFGFSLSIEKDGELHPNSDWPARLGFPIFIYQSLENLAGLGSIRVSSTSKPGKPFRFNLSTKEKFATVVSPDGTKSEVKPRGNGRFVFYQTEQLGVYKVLDSAGKHQLSLAVALNDREESNIGMKEAFEVGHEEVKRQSGRIVEAKSQLWKILLGSAFVVLLVEWYVFHRRSIM